MSLRAELQSWDGKSIDTGQAIYQRYGGQSSFVTELIELLHHNALQAGATWLLKRHLESDNKLTPGDISALYRVLPKLVDWPAKLHVLQSIPFMPIGKNEKKMVEKFVCECLADRNKFVRAWAYQGFYELSVQHPEYLQEAEQLVNTAIQDEAASVNARVRAIAAQKKRALKSPGGKT